MPAPMTSDMPLYECDHDAWHALLAEGNATQPRKRVGADVLIRDEHDRILLVDPRYKPDWDRPGGMSEANASTSIHIGMPDVRPSAGRVNCESGTRLGLSLLPRRHWAGLRAAAMGW
jgi:hypothetical protein